MKGRRKERRKGKREEGRKTWTRSSVMKEKRRRQEKDMEKVEK